jgi:hypothetical protein
MGTLNVTINSLPENNGSPITDIEYRVDGGEEFSSGGTGSFILNGLPGGTPVDVQIRAVNAIGPGAWSVAKTATPTGDDITAEVWGATGDSLIDGLWMEVYAREEQDTDWPGVKQVKNDGTISDDITPLDNQYGQPGGYDRFSLMEYFGKRRHELTGRTIYIIQCAIGGASIGGEDEEASQWMVGGALHEGAITRLNRDIATVIAAEDNAVFMGIVQQLGSNDYEYSPFYENSAAAVADMHSRIYMNGVSGETAAGNIQHLFITPRPERLRLADSTYKVGWALRDLSLETPGGRFYVPEVGYGDLHHFAEGVRRTGIGAAEILASTTPPSFTLAAASIGANDPYRQELVSADETARWYVSGADADDFEVVLDYYTLPIGGGNEESYRVRNFIQWKDGITHGTGTKNVTVNAVSGSGAASSQAHTVTIGAATLTSPTDTASGHNTADLSVTSALSSGTLYWYVSTSATPPSADDLIDGAGAVAFGSQTVSASGVQSIEATGLTADTEQFAHFLHVRTNGQRSAIVSGNGFTTDPVPSTGSIELVVHTVARYTGASTGATTDPINTSDADFLVISISGYTGGTPSVSDSNGNTWTPLTEHVDSESNSSHQHFYCANPTKGTGHTFTLSGDAVYGRINVTAWSGVHQSSPLDDEAATQHSAGTTPFTSGAITPAQNGTLLIAMLAGGTGEDLEFNGTPAFTELDIHAAIGGQTYRTALAYYVQETSASINSSWTSVVSPGALTASLTAFKPA